MTNQIGIREFKNQASKILRMVREEAAEYVITHNGAPVAILRPLTETDLQESEEAEIEQELAEMRQFAKEVAAAWTSDKTGVELIEEQRRY